MLVIVDNGRGAEEIARFVRIKNEILAPKEAASAKASAFILSDGGTKNQKLNEKLILSTSRPLLAIGSGYVFLASAYGAKAKDGKSEGQARIKIERPCALTLDMKRMFAVIDKCAHTLPELPENFAAMASSQKYEFEIIAEREKPFFGVHFNPELGLDGAKIIDNFVKFADVWEKYHK